MNILVAGGAGFIGSHTCVALLEAGHEVIVMDNLSNSSAETMEKIKEITGKVPIFYRIDVTKQDIVDSIFTTHYIEGVIHFAGLKSVRDSMIDPLQYYYNNLVTTMVLTSACRRNGVTRFVFSSSATVYGDREVPFVETMEIGEMANSYGRTKAMSETILADMARAEPAFSVALLRYFNPVGAHVSGLIGDAPLGTPNNLMPYMTRVARGKLEKLFIYGDDYPTVDGTGVRDYIHVSDLAEGHLRALDRLDVGVHIYNLGTGKGTSVLEMIRAFEEANRIRLPYVIAPRRSGDIAESYADVSKAKRELDWVAQRDIIDMCRDAWRFEKRSG